MDCQFCSKKIFGDTQLYLQHIKSNHPFEMTYKCLNEKCYRKFSSFVSLKKHLRTCLFQILKVQEQSDSKSRNASSLQTSVIFSSTENIPDDNSCYNTIHCPVVEENILSHSVQNCILKFVAQLYNKSNIT